jgi:hypothetical protein
MKNIFKIKSLKNNGIERKKDYNKKLWNFQELNLFSQIYLFGKYLNLPMQSTNWNHYLKRIS